MAPAPSMPFPKRSISIACEYENDRQYKAQVQGTGREGGKGIEDAHSSPIVDSVSILTDKP